MAAALDTMPMTLSPGLDALKTSPLSGSTESLHLGDYLDLGVSSSSSSPRPSHAPSPRMTRSSSNVFTAVGSSSTSVATNKTLASPTAAVSLPPPETQAPPPPGSSPEAVFRFYLKIELRKMGSPADDSIIDKYVQQHYSTFIKAMETGKAVPAPPIAPAGASIAASSPAQKLSKTPVATGTKTGTSSEQIDKATIPPANNVEALSSLSPQPQLQPFKVPLSSDAGAANMFDVGPSQQPLYDNIDPHFVQFGGTSATDFPGIKRESDAMSEDGGEGMDAIEEDSKDDLAPLISDMRFSAGHGGSDGSGRYGSDAGSSRGSEEPAGGIPLSIRDSAAADLRPTAEEYRALSSKEKRQLRNKISARNFRERRKEYITHLESKISSRDTIIDTLRAQLSAASLQNKKLEEEVKTLQARSLSQTDVQKILEALQNVTTTAGASYPANTSSAADWPQHQGALRSSAANDLTLSSAGAFNGSSRPSTPSSPRPGMVRRGSPSLGSSGQLPQHNPRKDIAVGSSAKGSSSSGGSGFWKGGPTVAASA
ncbi:hypothetical protein BCV69DRAFT_106039 [Microstroma glucosiphilum]|uniref:BZIP domain-containing protein n=1 Tax=Pseudomicrostroma glucosiphilum TaxID=1684307 RepID=A0A316UCZ6_9BASI|nr:hypothetical protein BCV69DRAFT_106039 [Pseudomicrostroma glucosiphilum]PWN23032.1 hypothetical protein BCV69DRAFT_106039 [Pseudomicrostroma glucosiphilum]